MDVLNHDSHLSNKGYSTSERNILEPRHRWYYYKEGFSVDLVDHAISESKLGKNDVILDPFGGSGTVNLCSSQKALNSVGIEVNPFAFFLTKAKHINPSIEYLKSGVSKDISSIVSGIDKGKKSALLTYSTFSELTKKDKWLFDSKVLNAYEGGYSSLQKTNPKYRGILKLALINAAMENCNARKDGKCLRYKTNWENLGFDKGSFLESFERNIALIVEDLRKNKLTVKPELYKADARDFLNSFTVDYKLCITSPPYLNSFDYTDVYRPELFLGKFVTTSKQLYNLRQQTLCSHINIVDKACNFKSSSLLYNKTISELNAQSSLFWNNNIPLMVKMYFHQMNEILLKLYQFGKKDSQLWLVVANSAYFNSEIPTDLILADLAAKIGWKLKEIHVLRDVFKRGSKYSPDVNSLRESAVVLHKV